MARKKQQTAHTNGAGNGSAAPDIEETFVTRKLPVSVDDARTAEFGKQLSTISLQIENVQAEKRAACSDANAQLKELRPKAHELAESIRNGTESVNVKCKETKNFRTNTATIVRCDTGEKVDERALNVEDRQAGLDLDVPSFDEEVPAGVDAVL